MMISHSAPEGPGIVDGPAEKPASGAHLKDTSVQDKPAPTPSQTIELDGLCHSALYFNLPCLHPQIKGGRACRRGRQPSWLGSMSTAGSRCRAECRESF